MLCLPRVDAEVRVVWLAHTRVQHDTCTLAPHLLGKTAISITLIAVHIYVRFTLRPRKEACMKRRKES